MVRLALRNLFQGRVRLVVSVGGVALALALILALDAIFTGLRGQITAYMDNAGADVYVSQAGVRNLHMVASTLPADAAEFRYPGPRPRSRETALVMLGDAVEAGVRVLEERTPERVRAAIVHLVDAKLASGQRVVFAADHDVGAALDADDQRIEGCGVLAQAFAGSFLRSGSTVVANVRRLRSATAKGMSA